MSKPKGYWTYENCKTEVLKYNTRKQFRIERPQAYYIIKRNGWDKEFFDHMVDIDLRKESGYWSKDKVSKIAIKCKTQAEFRKVNQGAWNAAKRDGYYDEITQHFITTGNRKNRLIYVYEFSDNHVYVGLTYNAEERHTAHMNNHNNNSAVFKHIIKSNLQPYYFRYTDYIPVEQAQYMEQKVIEEYENNCWNLLNRVKGGGIGGGILIWTKEKCCQEALIYSSKTDFQTYSPGAYTAALKNSWLSDITAHMIELRRPDNYWNFEKCYEEANKYIYLYDFRDNSRGAYESSKRNGWLPQITQHLQLKSNPRNYWTFERCKEIALKYKTRKEFQKNDYKCFRSADFHKWLPLICKHMEYICLPVGYWTYEKCKEESLKYNKRSDFKLNSSGAYAAARRNGWLDELTSNYHFKKRQSRWVYNKEYCHNLSLTCKSLKEFSEKYSGAYQFAVKNNFLNEITDHLQKRRNHISHAQKSTQ